MTSDRDIGVMGCTAMRLQGGSSSHYLSPHQRELKSVAIIRYCKFITKDNTFYFPFSNIFNVMTFTTSSIFSLPFSALPNPKRVWIGHPGSREEGLGKLSLLTPEIVKRAILSEVKTGERATLDWSLTKLEIANLNRQPCRHEIVPLLNGVAFDDIYCMNPRK